MSEYVSSAPSSRMASQLRRQLHEMMAAGQLLTPMVKENKVALEYLAILMRGMYVQLRTIRHIELKQQLENPDEIRLFSAPVELARLCQELVYQADSLVSPQEIRVAFDTPAVSLTTLADRNALTEMLLALLSHAIKSTAQKETIRLELNRQENTAVFSVTYTGRASEPASQQEFSNPDLELARQIAALHGGTLVLENQAGKGMRTVVSLPIRRQPSGVLGSPDVPMERGGGWNHVLVALADSLPAHAFLPQEPGL